MKKNQLFLGLATIAAAVFSFSSCSQDELSTAKAETPDQGQEIRLTTGVSTTRGTNQSLQETAVAEGIKVGVSVTNNGDTSGFLDDKSKNNPYTVSGTNLVAGTGNEICYPTSGNVDIYAYAPYQSGWTVTDVNANQNFTVQSDQTTDDNFLASDLIWATPITNQASSESAVNLAFVHKLSKININITNNRDGLSLKGANIYILNTKPTIPINLKTGTLGTEDGDVTAIHAATLATAEEPTSATASAIIVPQTLAANANFVKIVTDASYNNSVSTTLYAKLGADGKEFKTNIKYDYTVTIKAASVELSLGGITIGAWGTDSGSIIAEDAIGVGDYVLTDGTFLKASALTDENKSSVAGIIFSTNVSTNDATTYDAYVMGLTRQKKQYPVNDNKDTYVTSPAITTLADAISDMDGLYRTNTILASTYGQAISNTVFNVATWYTDRAFTAGTHSAWYLPSFGQLVEIFNNLGGANITTALEPVEMNSSSDYNITTDTGTMSTIMTTLQSKVTAVGISTSMFSVPTSGNIQYITSTENGSTATDHKTKMWGIKITSSALVFNKNMARVSEESANTYSVIPVAAVKLP